MFKAYIIAFYCLFVCASAHADEQNIPASDTAPSASISEKVSDKVQEVLLNALNLTGIPYKYGGKTPETGFDCSGFVQYVFKQALNLTLPYNARAMSQIGTQVSQAQLKPGDLVFFNTLKTKFSHVGIYIGNHRFIHSPSTGKEVKVVNMQEAYWANRYNGAVRVEHLNGFDPDSLQNAESVNLMLEDASPKNSSK